MITTTERVRNTARLQPAQEVKFHPTSVINPRSVPPGFLQVRGYFWDRVLREVR